MAKKLWSIFTDDMDTCFLTGATKEIERHHIFGSFNRDRSEKYGFVVPLHKSVHPNGASLDNEHWQEIDHNLKKMCQEYFVKHYGSKQDWYNEFGRYYDYDYEEEKW